MPDPAPPRKDAPPPRMAEAPAPAPAAAAPAAAAPAPAAPLTSVVVQGTPVAGATEIPDLSNSVPGGRFFVGGRWVDAHGNPRKEDEGKGPDAPTPTP